MSFRKKGRNFRTESGKTFPKDAVRIREADKQDYVTTIALTLHEAYGGTGRAIKTVMAYTDAGERTVKNWFEGKNGPNGENLVALLRHSDQVLEAVLTIAGRDEVLHASKLLNAREKLNEMLEIIDRI